MALFEGYERRIDKINEVLKEYGISSVEECRDICLAKGVDCDSATYGVSPNCVFKADRLTCAYDFVAIYAFCKTDVSTFFNGRNAIFFKNAIDFLNSSFITFK